MCNTFKADANTKFDLRKLKADILDNLLCSINSLGGSKHVLVLQNSFSSVINLLTPFNVLKEKAGIVTVLWLNDSIQNSLFLNDLNSFIFLCDNSSHNANLISLRIKELIAISSNTQTNFKYFGIVSDKISQSFEYQLEQSGIKGEIQLYPLDLSLSILNNSDLLTLNLSTTANNSLADSASTKLINDLYLNNINDSIFKLAKALLNLIVTYPVILNFNNVLIKGFKSFFFYKIFKILKINYLSNLSPADRKNEEIFNNSKVFLNNINNQLNLNSVNDLNHFYNLFNNQSDLIILDRSIDFVTPLLSQLTYQGLLDEVFTINSNIINLPSNISLDINTNNATTSNDNGNNNNGENDNINNNQGSGNNPNINDKPDKNKIYLNLDDDVIFKKIKDLNFASVGPILNKFAKNLQAEFDSRHSAKNVSEIREFVGKLSFLQKKQKFLKNHTLLAENILLKVKNDSINNNNYINSNPTIDNNANTANNEPADQVSLQFENMDDEENAIFSKILDLQNSFLTSYYDIKKSCDLIIQLMYQGLTVYETLRLCCLLSLVKNGINEKNYLNLKKEIILNYGYKHIITLQNLSKLKLFYIQESISLLPNLQLSINNSQLLNNDLIDELDINTNDQTCFIKDFNNLRNYLNLVPTANDITDNTQPSNDPNSKDNNSNNDLIETPNDASFAFINYVPITTRLIQSAYDRSFFDSSLSSYLTTSSSRYISQISSWKGLEDISRFLIGTSIEENELKYNNNNTSLVLKDLNNVKTKKVLKNFQSFSFIVMIGGITYGELATLRYIEKKLNDKGILKKFIILTDTMINGNSLIEACIPKEI
ncbi:tethering complex ATP-binding subunit VPS33 [Ascoidea rubescens DSM 1968]|uniref:Sec1-like protein n=1 Tax=Ascoidea rubescens DSM 1968 TaxID=1344418 RepID=A0A1D2VGJ9_9ASCO|nr:Sec1-like protein [Ascoidea rubescens DSM 1968]ODV60597.1 Sec1-like protein [Ascoidea rubescens DSM 1968]